MDIRSDHHLLQGLFTGPPACAQTSLTVLADLEAGEKVPVTRFRAEG